MAEKTALEAMLESGLGTPLVVELDSPFKPANISSGLSRAGRGPSGKVRNFTAMTPTKLQSVRRDIVNERANMGQRDMEVLIAINRALAISGLKEIRDDG